MTPLEALARVERWALGDEVMSYPSGSALRALCQGYRAALAEIEALKQEVSVCNALGNLKKEAGKYFRDEADRLAGLIRQAEWSADCCVCPWCSGFGYDNKHTDDCPAFTPDGEVKRK